MIAMCLKNPKKDTILTTQAHLKFYLKSLNSIRLSSTTYDLIRNPTSEYIYRIQNYPYLLFLATKYRWLFLPKNKLELIYHFFIYFIT